MNPKISIPKPCSENWNNMTPMEKGKFCELCNRKVHDLNALSQAEIIGLLKTEEKICGSVKKDSVSKYGYSFKKYGIALSFASLFGFTNQLYPNSIHQPFPQTEIIINQIQKDSIIIKGNVTVSKIPIPYVTIVLKNTKYETQTDLDGNFSITIPKKFNKRKLTLVLSSIETITKEVKIKNINEKLNIKLEEGGYIIGEVVFKKSFLRRLLG